LSIGEKIRWLFVGGGVVRLNRKASDAFNNEKFEEALRLLLRAERKYPLYEVTYHNLGNVFLALHKDVDAEKAFRKAFKLKPTFVEAMNDLAAMLVKKGRRDEAEAILRKAIEINPKYPYARVNLGRLLIDKGSFTEAETEWKTALESKDLDATTKKSIEEQLAL